MDSKVYRRVRRGSDKGHYVCVLLNSQNQALRKHSWGESAGAISVASHMLINGGDTEGLFRGAFMQSGSPIPVGDIEHGQKGTRSGECLAVIITVFMTLPQIMMP